MTTNLRAFAHSYCRFIIHLVFVTKYRHPVLTEQIEQEMIDMIRNVCTKNRCILLEAKADLAMKDHIHLVIDLAPDVAISTLAGTLKTVTSRETRKRHADHLKPYYWKPVFWKRGYGGTSAGEAAEDVIRAYVQNQGKDD